MKFSKQNFIAFTVTVASPAVFTSAAHELYQDDVIELETSGALPTGLAEDTDYFVVLDGITADTFQISATRRGTPINTSGTQSGTHTWIKKNRASIQPFIEDNR